MQLGAILEPCFTYIFKIDTFKCLEIGEGCQFLTLELAIEHSRVGYLHHIVDVKVITGNWRFVLHTTLFKDIHQGFVSGQDKAWKESVFIFRPGSIGLKAFYCRSYHLYLKLVTACKYALFQHHTFGVHRLYAIGAVGAEVEHVDVLQVGAVGKS